jgi:hypothetical protein
MLINEKYLRKKSGLDIKNKNKVAGFVGTNLKKRIKTIRKELTSYLQNMQSETQRPILY